MYCPAADPATLCELPPFFLRAEVEVEAEAEAETQRDAHTKMSREEEEQIWGRPAAFYMNDHVHMVAW